MSDESPDAPTARELLAKIESLTALVEKQAILLDSLPDRLDVVRTRVDQLYAESLFHLRQLRATSSAYLGEHTAITYLSNGYRAFIDTRARDVGIHMLMGGNWETEYTDAFLGMLRPGMRVLDVGANLGWYALQAAAVVGDQGTVLAIEPNEDLATLVDASFNVNGLSGFCRVVNAAVGDRAGVVDLFVDVNMSGGAIIRPSDLNYRRSTVARRKVEALTIDQVVAAGMSGPPDVIKMDIEGWEGMAFRGMTEVFASPNPISMMVEWSPMMDATPAPRSLTVPLLVSAGFTAHLLDAAGALYAVTWEDIVASPDLKNIFFIRGGR